MSVIIRVEHLSKRYIIRHQGQSGYVALRDVIADKVKDTFHKTKHLVSNKPLLKVATKEEFLALDDVSFEVHKSDRIGIIGRNGAGKSTLLKVLSRITEPTFGRFATKGRIASLLEVGTGFHPELTGRENIFLNGAILGMHRSEIKSKFDEIVDFSEVEKFLDTPVKRYSSGMYVRLAFAVAAFLESEILVVDEVLAVGDMQFQKKCLGKMQDVSQSEGRTVLFVSHNIGTINQLCNKGILLKNGKILEMGPTEDVVRKYMKTGSANGQIHVSSVAGPMRRHITFSEISINGMTSDEIHITPSADIKITLKGTCNSNLDYFRMGMTILKDGVKLFSIHNHPEPEPMKKGPFETDLFVPKYMLRPGYYSVSIFGHDDGHNRRGTDWIYGTEVLTFTIMEEWDLINDIHNEGIFNLPRAD